MPTVTEILKIYIFKRFIEGWPCTGHCAKHAGYALILSPACMGSVWLWTLYYRWEDKDLPKCKLPAADGRGLNAGLTPVSNLLAATQAQLCVLKAYGSHNSCHQTRPHLPNLPSHPWAEPRQDYLQDVPAGISASQIPSPFHLNDSEYFIFWDPSHFSSNSDIS